MRQFNTVEEADDYIGREVQIEYEKARLVEIRYYDELEFVFEYEDGTTETLNSLSAFYSVKIDGHNFGCYEK